MVGMSVEQMSLKTVHPERNRTVATNSTTFQSIQVNVFRHLQQVSSTLSCRTARITPAPRGHTPAHRALLLALLAQPASSARRRRELQLAATARWRCSLEPPRAHQVF